MPKIPCAIIRGGTSKGVYILEKYLPKDRENRDRVILSIFGSPDSRQIDGLGGADPLTSKLAIIAPANHPNADIDYTFAQVGIESGTVDYSWNCGNISSGVGPFAIEEGLVKTHEPKTIVRIFNTNTKKIIIAEVPVKNSKAETEGNCEIDGVPGKGAEIILHFIDPVGGATGRLLPTGNTIDKISLKDGREIVISIVDAGNLYLFVSYQDIGLKKIGSVKEIESQNDIFNILEQSKYLAVEIIKNKTGLKNIPLPKVAFVSEALDYKTDTGDRAIKKEEIDLISRIITSNKVHKAYAITGAIATAAASLIAGSVVNKILNKKRKINNSIKIGHPAGIIEPNMEYEIKNENLVLKSVSIKRTARRIMDGFVYIPEAPFQLKK